MTNSSCGRYVIALIQLIAIVPTFFVAIAGQVMYEERETKLKLPFRMFVMSLPLICLISAIGTAKGSHQVFTFLPLLWLSLIVFQSYLIQSHNI